MSQLLLIAVGLFLGWLLRRIARLPATTPAVLNAFIINVALPALTLRLVHSMTIDARALYPAAMAWIVFIVCGALVIIIGRIRKWSRRRTGALLLTACLGNTSFVGFPLLEAFFGPKALEPGILADQAGSFLVLSTLGLIAAAICSARDVSMRAIVRRIVSFAPFLSCVLALTFRGIAYPAAIEGVLSRLGDTLVPLALVSIGFQLKFARGVIRERLRPILVGLTIKLAIAPAIIYMLYVLILKSNDLWTQVSVAEAAMAPMITGAIIADEYGLEPELSNLMVTIGIPLSIGTVWLWVQLIR